MSLAIQNSHSRDSHIQFQEEGHIYTIDNNSDYKSVTTWVHEFFPHFDADRIISKMKSGKNWGPDNKYFGMTNEQIKSQWENSGKEARDFGTWMHLNIEKFYNNLEMDEKFKKSREYILFNNFYQDHKDLIPYRTEWAVYTKKYRLAGSVDMVFKDPHNKGQYIIADWKRCKEISYTNNWEKGYGPLSNIDNCNYWHYTLQLNVYKMILEKYYNLTISSMFLVVIHPSLENYKIVNISTITKPILEMLEIRKKQISENSLG